MRFTDLADRNHTTITLSGSEDSKSGYFMGTFNPDITWIEEVVIEGTYSSTQPTLGNSKKSGELIGRPNQQLTIISCRISAVRNDKGSRTGGYQYASFVHSNTQPLQILDSVANGKVNFYSIPSNSYAAGAVYAANADLKLRSIRVWSIKGDSVDKYAAFVMDGTFWHERVWKDGELQGDNCNLEW